MLIDFSSIDFGKKYSRPELAKLWGYKAYQALARGVVTPAGDNKIVLFVTKEKHESEEQYNNSFSNRILCCEGPTDHFAEQRMLDAKARGEEIHAFYRDHHRSDFEYLGEASLLNSTLRTGAPSSFTLQIKPN